MLFGNDGGVYVANDFLTVGNNATLPRINEIPADVIRVHGIRSVEEACQRFAREVNTALASGAF